MHHVGPPTIFLLAYPPIFSPVHFFNSLALPTLTKFVCASFSVSAACYDLSILMASLQAAENEPLYITDVDLSGAGDSAIKKYCKASLYVLSYGLVLMALISLVITLVGFHYGNLSAKETDSNCVELVKCGVCVSKETVCSVTEACAAFTLLGIILWSVYMMYRCYQPKCSGKKK